MDIEYSVEKQVTPTRFQTITGTIEVRQMRDGRWEFGDCYVRTGAGRMRFALPDEARTVRIRLTIQCHDEITQLWRDAQEPDRIDFDTQERQAAMHGGGRR